MPHHSRAAVWTFWLALAALALGACNTVPNVSLPISVPRELSEKDVELAILLAVAGQQLPALTSGQQITDEALRAVLGGYEGVRNKWFFEDRDRGIVFIGFQHRSYYMRVAARYTSESVTLSIVNSRNLRQKYGRIHERAHEWLQGLDVQIRQTLGAVVQRKFYGDPNAPE